MSSNRHTLRDVSLAMIDSLKGENLGVRADALRTSLFLRLGYDVSDAAIYGAAKMLQNHGVRVPTFKKGADSIWFVNPIDPAIDRAYMKQMLQDKLSETISNARAHRADQTDASQALADEYQAWAMDLGRRLGKSNAEVYAATISIFSDTEFETALLP